MNYLFIINDAPYGSEKPYNALRMAMTLQKEHAEIKVRIFLMADAVTSAVPNQTTPQGYYNVERMLKRVLVGTGQVLLCGTCMDARGLTDAELTAGARRSSMDELAAATVEADKVLVF